MPEAGTLLAVAGLITSIAGTTASQVTAAAQRKDAKKARKKQDALLVANRDDLRSNQLAGRSGTIRTAGALSQTSQPTASSALLGGN